MPFLHLGQEQSWRRRTRSQPGWVQVLIQDNGVGLSNFREGSLGYGLVRSLVQQIRGEIDIQSESGLTVTISFPESRDARADSAGGLQPHRP